MTGFPLSLRPHTFFVFICLIAASLSGCRDSEDDSAASLSEASRQCLSCHQTDLDNDHHFDCFTCHREGGDQAALPEQHPAIITRPAHPDNAAAVCGQCHQQEIDMVTENYHYRLTDHINLVRQAFDPAAPDEKTTVLTSLRSWENPESVGELVDDLLSRRCLRCHVYTAGDRFSSVHRGTGCAACHLDFDDGRMISHQFSPKPANDQCLSCHYASHVGYDFVGLFEHDFNEEYRTPYRAGDSRQPPFGVEAHQLQADVHHRAGMICIDCHDRDNVMGSSGNPGCVDCHRSDIDGKRFAEISETDDNRLVFTSSASGVQYTIPQIEHPAHDRYGERFSCQACHARWTFNDAPVHLLRIDHEEFYDFYKLSLDGSSEVLEIISSHIDEDGDLLEPVMSNKFTGTKEWGIWFKGFGERRWESVPLVIDEAGTVTTGRPILDLRLSWIDEDEQARFDNIEPADTVTRNRPYAAHSIGAAGVFYEERIRPFLKSLESLPQESD
jgi:hypothetical protein